MLTVSKAKLKAGLLEYLRQLEKTKTPIIITHEGEPVAKIVPFLKDPEEVLKSLRGTITFYEDPMEPVAEDEWEVLKD